MYHIKQTKNDTDFYLFFHFNAHQGVNMPMWTGNPQDQRIAVYDDLQEAMGVLLYLDNLSLQGKMQPMECLDVVDENGKEIYF